MVHGDAESFFCTQDDNHPLIQCCKENQGPGKLRELLRQYGHLTIQQKSVRSVMQSEKCFRMGGFSVQNSTT